MEKKIIDMLYAMSARGAMMQFELRKEFNLKKRILEVFKQVRENRNLSYDKKIASFFKKVEEEHLTMHDLLRIEERIQNNMKNTSVVFAFHGKHECEIPLEEEQKIIDFCDNVAELLEEIDMDLENIKTLIQRQEEGEDIFTVENLPFFESMNHLKKTDEEKEILISLYKSWSEKMDMEYQEEKEKQNIKQGIGTLLALKELKESHYPGNYENIFIEEDVKEQTSYIRRLIAQKEYDLATSLMGTNKEDILIRMMYEIEIEKSLLEKENTSEEDRLVIKELMHELVLEKERIQGMMEGDRQWKK